MKSTILTLAILLSGCAPERTWEQDQCMKARLFNSCMAQLPAGPVATHYNDWSEVVEACDDFALTTSVKQIGEPREICEGANHQPISAEAAQ